MDNKEKKIFEFFFKGRQQTLTVYQGTTQSEIIDTLKVLLKIQDKKKLLFMGQQGEVIVLSSALPDKTKLTIFDDDYQFLGMSQNNLTWVWKKDPKVRFFNDKIFRTAGQEKTTVYGDVKMKKGKKYWWRIQIKQIYCCQQIGVTSVSIAPDFWMSKPEKYQQTIGFPSRFPGENCGPGDTGCHNLKWNNHIFRCQLNLKNQTFTIYNQTLKRMIQNVLTSFDEAIPYFHSNKHQNQISLLETGSQ